MNILQVSVEGNIGSGKSTLIEHFNQHRCVEAVHEPVNKWTDLRGHNALVSTLSDGHCE